MDELHHELPKILKLPLEASDASTPSSKTQRNIHVDICADGALTLVSNIFGRNPARRSPTLRKINGRSFVISIGAVKQVISLSSSPKLHIKHVPVYISFVYKWWF
jgi:hypothetical protein